MTNNGYGRKVYYTPFNKPSKIVVSGDTVNFYYDPSKQRYKKKTNKYTSYYVGKSYEKIKKNDGYIEDKYFIYAGGKVISVYSELRSKGNMVIKTNVFPKQDISTMMH